MSREIFKYTTDKVTVVWKPKFCVHSALCFKGLPEVFDPKARPWVDSNGADANRIIEQVQKCPSGALSIDKEEEPTPLETKALREDLTLRVQANGPLLVSGSFLIQHSDGREEKREGDVALCRCGGSANKPYCDGSHRKIDFRDGG